ncbi:MAG: Ig-like domain-containing protein [Petrotogales bacterium]
MEKTIAKKQQVSWFSTRKIIAIVTIAIVVLAPTAYLLMAMSSVGNRNNDSISTLPQCTTLNPLGSSVSTSTELSVEFSEPMNKSSVEAAFSTSPEINGSFSWNENTLIFTPSDLLNKGTCSITCGINPYFFQD